VLPLAAKGKTMNSKSKSKTPVAAATTCCASLCDCDPWQNYRKYLEWKRKDNQPRITMKSNSPSNAAACSPVFLKLEEFTSGGLKYIRCADDDQRPLLSHILNGAGACFFAEELPKVQMTANAHGWVVHLILENSQDH
jgi:hypothetical protein